MAYTLSGSCGTVRLDARTTGVVINESVQRTSKVTSNPVEQGSDINDHVVNDPIKFTITGVTINGDGPSGAHAPYVEPERHLDLHRPEPHF